MNGRKKKVKQTKLLDFKLSAKGIMLLSFVMAPLLLSTIFKTGFLGYALSFILHFTVVPFSHFVTFRELYKIEFIYWSCMNILQIVNSPTVLSIVSPFIPETFLTFAYVALPIFFLVQIPFQAFMSCVTLRVAYRLYPKRLRIEKVGH